MTNAAAESWLLASLCDVQCEHQHLFELMHRYYAAVSGCRGTGALLQILDEIVETAADHFSSEEKLLQVISHFSLNSHKASHRTILQDLSECHSPVSADTWVAQVRAAHAMDALLIHHVRDDVDIHRLLETPSMKS